MKAASAARCTLTGEIPCGDGRSLRVASLVEPDGSEVLILAMGIGEGPSWREDPSEGLVVPVDVVPGLLEALERVRQEAA